MKITSLLAEGCQKSQKAINADHPYMFSNKLVGLVQTDRQTDRRTDKQTDRYEHIYN